MIVLALIIAIAIFVFWAILEADIHWFWKLGLVLAEMITVNQIFIRRYRMPSEIGLVLIKSKKGIDLIERLSKSDRTFKFLSDVGNSIAYGLSSIVITRKNRSFESVVIGMLLLGFLSLIVAPNAFFIIAQLLQIDTEGKAIASIPSGGLMVSIIGAFLLIGGIFLFVLFGIVLYGAIILKDIIDALFFGSSVILERDPGAHLLLPGVNLPFFEGIIALVVVMIMHEGAHAVLARIGKIPVQSSGIVLFGVIPVGAFVEPDESRLRKADDMRQTRVLVAGCTSNLITSGIVFLLFAALVIGMNATGLTENAALGFLRTTLGLTFALNFIVGAINLLPLPVFDGYRLLEVNIKNRLILSAVMYVTLAAFILNILPWFFRG